MGTAPCCVRQCGVVREGITTGSERWAVPRELAAASPRIHEACLLLPVGGRSTQWWMDRRHP